MSRRPARANRLCKRRGRLVPLERSWVAILLRLQVIFKPFQSPVFERQAVGGKVRNKRLFRGFRAELYTLVGNRMIDSICIVTICNLLLILLCLRGVLGLQVG